MIGTITGYLVGHRLAKKKLKESGMDPKSKEARILRHTYARRGMLGGVLLDSVGASIAAKRL